MAMVAREGRMVSDSDSYADDTYDGAGEPPWPFHFHYKLVRIVWDNLWGQRFVVYESLN